MTVKETAAFLRQHDNYLILTHKRPDGDTIGCAAALCEGLRALGRTAWICPHTEETHLFTPYLEGRLAPEGYVPETVVSVDIAARSLFTRAGEPWLARGVDLAIDHHPSNTGFAAVVLGVGREESLVGDVHRHDAPGHKGIRRGAVLQIGLEQPGGILALQQPGLLAQRPQRPAQRHRRADGVAVRPFVSQNQNIIPSAQQLRGLQNSCHMLLSLAAA